jgi:hypothetical protein
VREETQVLRRRLPPTPGRPGRETTIVISICNGFYPIASGLPAFAAASGVANDSLG